MPLQPYDHAERPLDDGVTFDYPQWYRGQTESGQVLWTLAFSADEAQEKIAHSVALPPESIQLTFPTGGSG